MDAGHVPVLTDKALQLSGVIDQVIFPIAVEGFKNQTKLNKHIKFSILRT
jgi:hypothetical protein